ncbi:MAG: hypothetical protein Q4C54_00200 [Clostridia bacterium]|nr:hypothetical protein [Clostridia bacterium]
MRKLMAMLTALLLAVCAVIVPAGAEGETPSLAQAQPLMDLTVAAALAADVMPESITADGQLSENFVYQFFLLGQGGPLGITAEHLSDPALQREFLTRAFVCRLPEQLDGILGLGLAADYTGLRVSAADFDPEGTHVRLVGDVYRAPAVLTALTEEQAAKLDWLDHRAVMELEASADAPGGWKVVSCSFDDELNVEALTESYFNQVMLEYMGGDLGFSIQYPAVFTEDVLEEENGGLKAQLPDGSASFFVRRTENAQHLTLEQLLEGDRADARFVSAETDPVTGCGKTVLTAEDGSTVVNLYLVSDAYIYQAQLTYRPEKAGEFSLYADYMMNSFSADEFGIG